MNYFYKEKGYYYIGFPYRPQMVEKVKKRFKDIKYNPANKEWYIYAELWNLPFILKFLKEYQFVEKIPDRKRTIPLAPIEEDVTLEDIELILPTLNLNRTLRDYQKEALQYFFNHGNCINGCDCGLGKSCISIFYLEMAELFPSIIVCPASVKESWRKEWKRISPNRSVSVIDSQNKTNDWSSDIVIINYDILGEKDGKGVKIRYPELTSRTYQCIISDEIHFLKNPESIRSKSFKKIAKSIPNKMGLSGTSIMSRPSEIKNLLKILDRFNDIFPDDFYFNYRYCNMKVTDFGNNVSCSSNLKELHEILSHYCYFRREKRDVLDELPPVTEQLVEIKIKNKKKYQKAETEFIEYIRCTCAEKLEAALKANQLVQLSVLNQLSVEGKMKGVEMWLKEWIEANEDEKIILFGIRKDPLKQLHEKFPNSVVITGEDNASRKTAKIEEFRKDKQILFSNIQCIGTGVDGLQEFCSNMAFMELPNRPSDLSQAISRLERMGQKYNINCYFLLSMDTIDVKMWKLLSEKKKVTDITNKGYIDDISLQLLNSFL